MPLFIPEWTRVSGRDLQLKLALAALDDASVVRRPLRTAPWAPDFFIQHPERGWLALAVTPVPFAVIDPAQLFGSEQKSAFEALLARFGTPASEDAPLAPVPKLALLWACSADEVDRLAAHYETRFGVRLVARDTFEREAAAVIASQLERLHDDAEAALRGRYFPEAEVPAARTTRRYFHRDNSARLARYFLDPEQEWACKLDLEPAAGAIAVPNAELARDFSVRLINGVAGSGKTLIALNRALLLAELFPAQRILMLIHNTPIVADLKDRLHRAQRGLPKNLEITTFFGWARRQWQAVFQAEPQVPGAAALPALIRKARRQVPALRLSDDQLLDELDFINDAVLGDEAAYLAASRAGRGFALKAQERAQVWAIYCAVDTALREQHLQTWSTLPRDLCLVDDHRRLRRHHHILVDEAQFFAPSWFQLVKLSMEPQGHLFVCADPNQGFLRNRLSWKSVGLDVVGRTKKLRKSYRTTRAILETANRLLARFVDDDPEDFLAPDFSDMEAGVRPALIYRDSPQDVVDRVSNEVEALAQRGRVKLSDVLVLYGDAVDRDLLYRRLVQRLGAEQVWWVNEAAQKKRPPGGFGQEAIRLANVETATGLEGAIVFLLGLEPLFFEGDVPGLSHEERLVRREVQARKLYMAMTRAGRRLVLVLAQPLPGDVEQWFELMA